MKKLTYILFLVLMVTPVELYAQKLDIRDHYKYWYYRQRLVDEFVILGEADQLGVPSGLSIPALAADHIGKNTDKLTLCWIDNPIQGLGRYIGVLATELALLHFNGEPYEQTQWELYCAMKAYERLDYNCEELFYPSPEGINLIGLFCRSDVPGDFTGRLYVDFMNDNHYNDFVHSTFTKYLDECVDASNPPTDYTFYNSSEEWEGMLTGFALLVRSLASCPEEVVIYNGYRFIDEAILHTQRYMDYFISNDWIYKLTTGETTKDAYDNKFSLGLYGQTRAADYICDPDRQYAVSPLVPRDKIYSTDLETSVNPITDLRLYIALANLGVEFAEIKVEELINEEINDALEIIANLIYNPNNPADTEPSALNDAKYILWTVFSSSLFNESFDFDFIVELNNELSDIILDYQKFGWNMFGNPGSKMLGQDSIGNRINSYLRDEQTYIFNYSYLEHFQPEFTYDCTPDPYDLPGICSQYFSGFTFEYDYVSGTLKSDKGNRWPASTAYTLAAIGDSWIHRYGLFNQNTENVTFESLCHYTDPIDWTIFPILNLFLHPKVKDADYERKKLISQLQTAPCNGPHFLPDFNPNKSEGVPGWRSGYRWHASLEQINGIPWQEDGDYYGAKHPGLDYMIAYNLLWLECIQMGLFDEYFDFEGRFCYKNLLDRDYNIIYGDEEVIYFDFEHNASITLEEGRSGMSYYPHDLKIMADQITIAGEQGFGDGQTLELVPNSKVNYCDIEEYLVP